MENSLKQRIVGAVVLIALAVIFLPSILKEKDNQMPFRTKIPAKPAELQNKSSQSTENADKNSQVQQALDQLTAQTTERKTKQSDETLETTIAQASEPQPQTEQAKTETHQPDPPSKPKTTNKSDAQEPSGANALARDDDPIATISEEVTQAAWVIQIASFSNKDNAMNFIEKLKSAGHKAYYRNTQAATEKQTLYRIYVGPYIEKQNAQQALQKINKLSALSGIILAFDPIKH